MKKMKAYARTSEKNNNVELIDVNIPAISEEEVLIEVAAFGVGIHDRYFLPQEAGYPFPIGIEGAGIITETGQKVTDFQTGDRVIFSSSMQLKGGCWTEYVAVSSKAVIKMPDSMDFTLAASLPVAGKTALESIHALNLSKGDTLFVAGASGAVGTLVIQLANNSGIRVVGSASSKNHEYMKNLGVELAVDYNDSAWKEQVMQAFPHGVDKALAIQPNTAVDSVDVVKDGGVVITVSGDQVENPARNIEVKQFIHELTIQEALGSLMKDIEKGQVEVVLEHVYPFEEALTALEKTETRHARGKLVVTF